MTPAVVVRVHVPERSFAAEATVGPSPRPRKVVTQRLEVRGPASPRPVWQDGTPLAEGRRFDPFQGHSHLPVWYSGITLVL